MNCLQKLFLIVVAIFLLIPAFAQNAEVAEMTIFGIYHGKNITIQNPIIGNKVYCTNEVYLNNKKVMSNIASSLYEVNLSMLKIGDSVTVVISHKAGCQPKVLNPQVLRPSPTFQYISVSVDKDFVKWSTQGERSSDIYFLEQFSNHNWLILQKFNALGISVYSVPVRHSVGTNRYRIRYVEKDGRIFYSKEVEFKVTPATVLEPVTFYPRNVTDKIYLSRPVPYQVIAQNGTVLKRGNAAEILLTDLKTGVYYLAVDNKKEKFFKK